MTNKPTIDGVIISYELGERIYAWLDRLNSKSGDVSEADDLRALLDAPAVERQKPVHNHDCCANCMRPRMEHCGEKCPAPNTTVWHAWDYDFAPGTEATPELDALQSTIAQLRQHKNDYMEAAEETRKALTADIAQLQAQLSAQKENLESAVNNSVMFAEKADQLQARIAELEKGRGEPFMYGIAQPDGTPHYSEFCVSGEASDLEGEVESMNEDGEGLFRIVALFAAPSAPVTVEVDERAEFVSWVRRDWPQAPLSNVRDLLPKEDPRYGEYCDETLQRAWVGWQARACLDATAALNEEKQ